MQQQWSSLKTAFEKYWRGPQTSRKNRGPQGVRGVRRRTPGVRKLGAPPKIIKFQQSQALIWVVLTCGLQGSAGGPRGPLADPYFSY